MPKVYDPLWWPLVIWFKNNRKAKVAESGDLQGPASSFEEIMSPIALADARTTKRRCCFCLAVTFFLFVSSFAGAQFYSRTQELAETRFPNRIHPVLVVAGFSTAVQGQPFASALRVAGGTAPYRFWIAQGALPSGLSLNSSTGTISGVPTVSGSFAFTVAATDSQLGYGRQLLHLDVSSGSVQNQVSIALSPETAQIAPGAKVQFTATVRNTSQTSVIWSASAGSISPSGLFTAPSRTGTAVITATAAASSGVHTSASISVQSASPLTIATSWLTNAKVNAPYNIAMIAQGGTAPYAWSLYSGSLPSGLTLNSSGVIAGEVLKAGTFTFTTKVTDASNHSSTRQLTLNASVTNPGSFDGPAELPRVHFQSALANTPAPGNTVTVSAGGSFQSALNNASCGDTIQLQAGATFAGSFTLPAKNCDDSNWIIIRSSAPDASLPAEGTRITPCYAGVASLPGRPALNCASTRKVMATLMAENAVGPITLAAGANHYRIGPGLEITRSTGTGINYGLIIKDAMQSAHHIVVDRDWVHGTARDETTRGVFLSGLTYGAITDSYFSDFHCTAGIGTCVDSQAISGGTGPLPQGVWKIHNNFLEAAAENILFGGVKLNSATPTDIEITQNHLFKPWSWMPGQASLVGEQDKTPSGCPNFDPKGGGQCPFIVKNLFELKNAQRVLFEGNVLENAWSGFTQHGQSILIEGANPNHNAIYSSISVMDVTIRFNRISHTHSGFGIINPGFSLVPNLPVGRISVHDDIFDDISAAYGYGDDSGAWALEQTYCGICIPSHDIAINHITEIIGESKKLFMVEGGLTSKPIQNWAYTNSIVSTGGGLVVSGAGALNPCGFYGATNWERIASCTGSFTMVANALIGATGSWPRGNFYPSAGADVGFVDYNNGNGGDYHLSSSSPYKNKASDGMDLGANVDAVTQATDGAL